MLKNTMLFIDCKVTLWKTQCFSMISSSSVEKQKCFQWFNLNSPKPHSRRNALKYFKLKAPCAALICLSVNLKSARPAIAVPAAPRIARNSPSSSSEKFLFPLAILSFLFNDNPLEYQGVYWSINNRLVGWKNYFNVFFIPTHTC